MRKLNSCWLLSTSPQTLLNPQMCLKFTISGTKEGKKRDKQKGLHKFSTGAFPVLQGQPTKKGNVFIVGEGVGSLDPFSCHVPTSPPYAFTFFGLFWELKSHQIHFRQSNEQIRLLGWSCLFEMIFKKIKYNWQLVGILGVGSRLTAWHFLLRKRVWLHNQNTIHEVQRDIQYRQPVLSKNSDKEKEINLNSTWPFSALAYLHFVKDHSRGKLLSDASSYKLCKQKRMLLVCMWDCLHGKREEINQQLFQLHYEKEKSEAGSQCHSASYLFKC